MNLSCAFGFHKWVETYAKRETATITEGSFFGGPHKYKMNGIVGIEKCSKCGRERAYFMTGNREISINVRYAKEYFRTHR